MALSESLLNNFRLIQAGLVSQEQRARQASEPGLGVATGTGPAYEGRLTAAHTLKRHQHSRAWLQAVLPKGEPAKTVVITHHFPHRTSCAPQWLDDPLTSIFGYSTLPEEILLVV